MTDPNVDYEGNDTTGGRESGSEVWSVELGFRGVETSRSMTYLTDVSGTVNLVMDLHIVHELWGE